MGYNYYDYGTTYDAGGVLTGIIGGAMAFILIVLIIITVVGVLQTIATWKIFKKAGKGGWEAIVPFYRDWVLVEISGLNWWWFLFLFAPLVTSFIGIYWLGYLVYLFATFNCYYNLSKKFNKSVGFAVCLTLFTPICLMILGFSKKNVYNSSINVGNNGIIPANGSNPNVDTNAQSHQYYNQSMNNQVYNQQPVQPMQPAQPVQPVQPMQPVQPVQPVQSSVAANACTKCGSPINPGDKFCMRCGNPTEQLQSAQSNTCMKCGSPVNPGDKFCMRCGNQL